MKRDRNRERECLELKLEFGWNRLVRSICSFEMKEEGRKDE